MHKCEILGNYASSIRFGNSTAVDILGLEFYLALLIEPNAIITSLILPMLTLHVQGVCEQYIFQQHGDANSGNRECERE